MENRGRGFLLKNPTLFSVIQLLNWFISLGGQTSFTEHWVYSSHFYLNFCDLHILISTSYWYYSIFNRSTLLKKKFKRCVFPSAYKCQWVCRVGSIGPLLPSSGLLVYPLDSWGEAVDCQVGSNIHWGEFQRSNCAAGISKNKSSVKGQLPHVLHHMWTLKRQIVKKQRRSMVVIRSTGRGRLHNGTPIQWDKGYSPLFAARRASGGCRNLL